MPPLLRFPQSRRSMLVTLAGAAVTALVYAASIDQVATRTSQMMVHSADVVTKTPFAPISITGGVLADEAMALFAKCCC